MTFSSPQEERWFEDYVPGQVHEFGSTAVREEEIVAYGRRFDPQPFHVDPEAAKRTEYGGLIASGWHTAGLMMRMYTEHYLPKPMLLASPGVDEVRWTRPVRPGDVLSLRITVKEARPSRSKPDRGIVRSAVEVLNQHGEVVMTVIANNFFLRRPEPR